MVLRRKRAILASERMMLFSPRAVFLGDFFRSSQHVELPLARPVYLPSVVAIHQSETVIHRLLAKRALQVSN